MTNKLYQGIRGPDGFTITVDGKPLDPRLDLRNHSPTGFEVGYGGSGPAQTALALLADALGDDDLAQQLYQRFKREWVATIDRDRFLLTQGQIRYWVAEALRREQP